MKASRAISVHKAELFQQRRDATDIALDIHDYANNLDNYVTGWSLIAECFTVPEIVALVKSFKATTTNSAIHQVAAFIDERREWEAEQSSEW